MLEMTPIEAKLESLFPSSPPGELASLYHRELDVERPHALLSASASHRWLECPASVKANMGRQRQTSMHAEEGSTAHKLAEFCFYGMSPYETCDEPAHQKISTDIRNAVDIYIDFVRGVVSEDALFFFESIIDYSHISPNSFGTADAFAIDCEKRTCQIFDLKYGVGNIVSAQNNTQLMLYASGISHLLKTHVGIEIEEFTLYIIQPRLLKSRDDTETRFVSIDRVDAEKLKYFESYARERAALALSDTPPFNPGETQCQWCDFRAECPALGSIVQEHILNNTDNFSEGEKAIQSIDNLVDETKRKIYENKELIKKYVKAVEDSVYDSVCAGKTLEGYKLVEGRKTRRWNDAAAALLEERLGAEAYEKKLIGVTKAEKHFTKSELEQMTYLERGKAQLVPIADKRPALSIEYYKKLFEQSERD